MFRTARHFDKNDGKHNFFGEIEYINDWDEDEVQPQESYQPDDPDEE